MSEATTAPSNPLSSAQRKQVILLTVAALVVYAVFRWMPTGTNLAHGDFRLEGDNVLEFCDPASPQFLPVTTARSPVEFIVLPEAAQVNELVDFTFSLATASGKPIGPVDLLVSHTEKLHLMLVDPSLTDYQHVHPTPGEVPGEWHVSFAPKFAGTYRIFADFMPAATARGLYASVDIDVPGTPQPLEHTPGLVHVEGPYTFELNIDAERFRARESTDLTLRILHDEGEAVQLGEIMGSFAHLVAFDDQRSGFAHLHPQETDLESPPDAFNPELHFNITIPNSGRYVIWAQVIVGGEELFIPFWFDVEP